MLIDLKNRLQFVIVIVMFFPVMLDALYRVTNTDASTSGLTMLKFSSVIAATLISYLILEILGEKMWGILTKIMNVALLVEVGLFILIFYFLADGAGKTVEHTSTWMLNTYAAVFWSALLIPVIMAGLCTLNLIWNLFNPKSMTPQL